MWVVEGTPGRARRVALVAGGRSDRFELRLASAVELLDSMDEPADLILTDPPYGLGVGSGARHDTGQRVYGRDHARVVAGYADVPTTEYRDFTSSWVAAAASALRPGGHLVVITGPQQAAWVQIAAEDVGLTYVNSLAVGRVFPLYTKRRFAHSHWRVTVMAAGMLYSSARVFNPPSDLPKARSGRDYPLDLWPTGDVGRADAQPGQVRYPNSLPIRFAARLVEAFTRPGESADRPGAEPDLVVDPFVGGGTVALAAWLRGVRFLGGDVNPNALAFTCARVTRRLLDPVALPGPLGTPALGGLSA